MVGSGEGRQYLEKENIFFSRGKRRTIFEEGKYLEKENIWSTEEKKKNGEGKGGTTRPSILCVTHQMSRKKRNYRVG